MGKYVLSLDQGTASCRAILFDKGSSIIGIEKKEFRQIYPEPGWVEQDAEEIRDVQLGVMKDVFKSSGVTAEEIAAIGITNQRETTVIWNKHTGKPIYNAIVWQSRQTASICKELKDGGWESYINQTTGLVIDAYFSATKIKWILEHVNGAKEQARNGDLLCGTIDAWLIWNLTGGEAHVTDYSNASRTMLYNIHTLDWDQKILDLLDIPRQMLPEVKSSSEIYGFTRKDIFDGINIPISGSVGDQQAALFGQTCFQPGMVKNTYGTGSFILMNTGRNAVKSEKGLLTTIAWGINGEIEYALEGSIFIAGAAIGWLRDGLELISSLDECEELASGVEDTNGVYAVPAFAGLGAPYWDMYARGAILGLTAGTGRRHIVRAFLESIVYQSKDIIDIMQEESGLPLVTLKADGGASKNDFLLQFQADLTDTVVERPRVMETTALGAAYLAGLAVGFWKSKEEITEQHRLSKRFIPSMSKEDRNRKYKGWKRAVDKAMNWESPDS